MRISVVVENTSTQGLPVEHGLSLWVEACSRRFFFDLGQGELFARNAQTMGVDVADAEFAVISHGHYDHGGGIATFLSLNNHAPLLLHRRAFTKCFSLKDGRARYIGLDKSLQGNERLRLTDDITYLSNGLTLFAGCVGHVFFSPANQRILKEIGNDEGGDFLIDKDFEGKERCHLVADDFLHEQSLIIEEGERRVLIAGCAHSGILNIMAKAEQLIGAPLTDVITGMHLVGVEDNNFIDAFARELAAHPCHYYTCHCTGEEAFIRLKTLMPNQISYIRCGEEIVF